MIEIEKEKLKELLARAFEEGFCGYKDLKDDVIEVLVKEVEEIKVKPKFKISEKFFTSGSTTQNPLMGTFNNFIDTRDRNVNPLVSGITIPATIDTNQYWGPETAHRDRLISSLGINAVGNDGWSVGSINGNDAYTYTAASGITYTVGGGGGGGSSGGAGASGGNGQIQITSYGRDSNIL